jgi:GNAT superfamily N-acetyltransferase
MTDPLVPSADMVKRVVRTECQYTLSRLRVLERLPGNPVGVEYKQFGEAFCLSARHLPNSSFNRVVGLGDEHADEVPGLIGWFEDRNIAGRFEIIPGLASPRVLNRLVDCGYAQTEFHAVLYGRPQPMQSETSGVTVEVVDKSTLEQFLDCYAAGWEVGDATGFKNNVRGWLSQLGWTLYLGRYLEKPAGGAILYLDGRTAYCADSAVDPALRGHGVHQALLQRRSADAAAAGADLLCAQAAYLSTSQRNMIRAGLALLSTKAIWTRVGQ